MTPAQLHTDGLPQPQRRLAFASVALTLFVAVLDASIANIALPPITNEFGIRPVDAIWVVNGYQLAVTVALLPLASLGEIFGYKRVYLGGLAVFTLASLICALSGSLEVLVAGRILQGLGAAGVMSLNIALVRFIFPRSLIGRAIGYTATVVGVSSAAGPSIAGLILSVAPWQALFLINLPVGLLALMVGMRTLPATPLSPRRFDVLSAVLSALTFGLVISGVNGLSNPPSLPWALGMIGAGVVIGIFFTRYQLTLSAPMLPVDLLRRPVFALSAASSIAGFSAQSISFVCLPFLLHDAMGKSAAETGLLLTPWPIATAVAAMLAGRLADRFEAGRLAALGLAVLGTGLLLLATLPAGASDLDLIWRLVLCGAGFGLFQVPNNKVLISSAPRERSGGASAIQSTARLSGQSLGVAGLAVVFGLVSVGQYQFALGVACCCALAGVLPSALRRSAAEPAH